MFLFYISQGLNCTWLYSFSGHTNKNYKCEKIGEPNHFRCKIVNPPPPLPSFDQEKCDPNDTLVTIIKLAGTKLLKELKTIKLPTVSKIHIGGSALSAGVFNGSITGVDKLQYDICVVKDNQTKTFRSNVTLPQFGATYSGWYKNKFKS